MGASAKDVFQLGDVTIDTARGQFLRDGQPFSLRPKTFQVLLYLLHHRDRLVSKEELMSRFWEGVAVTDDSLVQCITEIRKALGDDPKKPRFIKTVPKSGYRFIGEPHEPVEAAAARRTKWAFASAAAGIGIVAALLTLSAGSSPATDSLAPERSLAVLYFDNQSKSAELDWLREGLSDMLITGLARAGDVSVVSRQELAALLRRSGHRGENVQLEQALEVARKSRAAYLVLGSFSRLGAQIRLDIHLHEAQAGRLVAAEKVAVDQPEQLLAHLDVVSLKLAALLGGTLPARGRHASLSEVTTNNLEAYRYYSLGLEKAHGFDVGAALGFFEKAAQLDPDFAMAHARIGYVYAITGTMADKGRPYLEKAFRLSGRLSPKEKLYIAAWYAISRLDYPGAIGNLRELIAAYPFEIEAYWRLGQLLRGEDRLAEAANVLRQAMIVAPDSREIANALGGIYSELNRHEEAIAMRKIYLSLAPGDPNAHDSLGLSYQWAGKYSEAAQEYLQALAAKPDFPFALAHLGDLYVRLGRYRDALREYERYIDVASSPLERARGYGSLAWVRWRLGDRQGAEGAGASEALQTEEFAVGSAWLALERGDLAAARRWRTALFATSRNSPRGARQHQRMMHYLDGRIAFKEGRVPEALAAFRRVLRSRPVIWNIHSYEDCLAEAFLDLGRHAEAIAESRRVLAINPNDAMSRFRLGLALWRTGGKAEGREQLRRFLEIWKDADPEIPELIEAKRLLEADPRG